MYTVVQLTCSGNTFCKVKGSIQNVKKEHRSGQITRQLQAYMNIRLPRVKDAPFWRKIVVLINVSFRRAPLSTDDSIIFA